MSESGRKVVARNRKATFNYALEETFEAGIVLTGPEIKSIRANRVNFQDGFVEERGGELWLMGMHISPYEQSGIYGRIDPDRPRKLLLHRKEIRQIISRIRERGYTCIPTSLYLVRGKAKLEIALARGKKLYDKRADIAKRDSDREIRQTMKERSRE
ncbi:MAG: SsrA-binding protein SmpB [Anaerolineae bacterium]|nr:SsrA-binding protein SmpB [Anaerolineae bacterium]